jgi:hypothetical protein
MRMPAALRNLDDRVLGDRGKSHEDEHADVYPDERREPARGRDEGPPASTGDGFREFLGVVVKVSRLVFLLLALVVFLGIVFTIAPTNGDNPIVSTVFDVAAAAAGPFSDVFTVADDEQRELVVNYGFAVAVYLLASVLVTKLPGTTTN